MHPLTEKQKEKLKLNPAPHVSSLHFSGVKRTSADMCGGEVKIGRDDSPYATTRVTYTAEDFDKLLNLATYNILCSKELLLQSIEKAVLKRQNTWLDRSI